jgi:ubiquinone/menaquinone biosynthesis C-methylase UbiE
MMDLNPAQASSQAQFDKQSSRYGKSHILADTSDLDRLVEGLDVPTSGRALDVASGGGHTALWLAKRGLDVTATDLSARMLENAAAMAADEGRIIQTRQHPAEALPYPDATFDVVTCRVAAHHFSSPGDFVCESARVLKPNGFFLLIDGSVPDDEAEAAGWMNTIEKLRDPSHGRLLSQNEWQQLCDTAALHVIRSNVSRLSQPDLEWYFETANTPAANRETITKLYDDASDSILSIYQFATVNGCRTWQWHRLLLAARK